MRKNVIYLVACTVIMILTASYADISKGGTAQKTIPEFVLTYAKNQAEDHPTTQRAYRFTEPVYEKTGGKTEVQVNAGGVLRDEETVIEQPQLGGMDFVRVSLSPLARFVPKLNVPQVPHLYTEQEHVRKVLEGPIGMDFMNSFGGSSLAPPPWYDVGTRNFCSTDRPIESLDDMRGLEVRAQKSEPMMGTIQALGATPVPMVFRNVYSSLQTGETDGAENNWPPYESIRHYEMVQYFTLDEHIKVPGPQLAAQSTWDELPEECGNIIRGRTRRSVLYERELWAECEGTSEDRVRGASRALMELDTKEKERFREVTAPMYKKYCSEYMDIIDDIMDTGRQ